MKFIAVLIIRFDCTIIMTLIVAKYKKKIMLSIFVLSLMFGLMQIQDSYYHTTSEVTKRPQFVFHIIICRVDIKLVTDLGGHDFGLGDCELITVVHFQSAKKYAFDLRGQDF